MKNDKIASFLKNMIYTAHVRDIGQGKVSYTNTRSMRARGSSLNTGSILVVDEERSDSPLFGSWN